MLEGKRPTSFLELEQQPTVNPDDLIYVFEDYVRTGAAISARSVMGIIRRTPLGLPHLGAIPEFPN